MALFDKLLPEFAVIVELAVADDRSERLISKVELASLVD